MSNNWPFFTGVPGSMVVTWTTFNKTESKVEYSLLGGRLFDMTAKGDATLFVDSGEEKRKMYIHRVKLTGLKPATAYGGETWLALILAYLTVLQCYVIMKLIYLVFISVYHCGSDEGWSDVFFFTALNDSTSFSPRFALYGDLGNENPQSLARLQKETQLGMYDVVLHIGTLYCILHSHSSKRGIHFFISCNVMH